MSFAEREEDDEQWLKEPEIDSPVGEWREQHKPKRRAPRPIFVGSRRRTCLHCQQPAAVELFRDGKCLACQAADFLGPL